MTAVLADKLNNSDFFCLRKKNNNNNNWKQTWKSYVL